MEKILLEGVEFLINNSENITMGAILLVSLLLLGAIVFTFVQLAMKIHGRNQDDRAQERAGDQQVIDRLFELIHNIGDLSKVLDALGILVDEQTRAYAVNRELNEQYLEAIKDIMKQLEREQDVT